MTTLPEIKEVNDVKISRDLSQDKEKDSRDFVDVNMSSTEKQVCLVVNRSSHPDNCVTKCSSVSFFKDDHHHYQNLLPVTSISNNSLNINVFGVDDVTKVYSHDVFCAPVERNNSINSDKSRVGLFSSNSAGVIGTKIRNKSISFVFSNNCGEYEDINVFVETKSPATIHSNKN